MGELQGDPCADVSGEAVEDADGGLGAIPGAPLHRKRAGDGGEEDEAGDAVGMAEGEEDGGPSPAADTDDGGGGDFQLVHEGDHEVGLFLGEEPGDKGSAQVAGTGGGDDLEARLDEAGGKDPGLIVTAGGIVKDKDGRALAAHAVLDQTARGLDDLGLLVKGGQEVGTPRGEPCEHAANGKEDDNEEQKETSAEEGQRGLHKAKR